MHVDSHVWMLFTALTMAMGCGGEGEACSGSETSCDGDHVLLECVDGDWVASDCDEGLGCVRDQGCLDG